jgi:hypothetical protein
VELQPDGKWRASTRRALLGHFEDRDSAVAAIHAVLDLDEGAS